MKFYIRHKIRNVVDIKWLEALEYLDFEGKYKNYVEKHDFWEICYVEKGSVDVSVNGQIIELSENQLFVISPDVLHSYTSHNGNKSRAFVVCFECFSQALKTLSGMTFTLDENTRICFDRIVCEYKNTFYMNDNDLLEVLQNANFGGQQAIIIQLEYLFICLLRSLSTNKNPEIIFLDKEDFYSELTEVIVRYFKDNISKKISLDDVCEKVNYSRSFLCKTFKEQTGESLFSYFNRMKIEEAKRLFAEKNLTVTEVSSVLGFTEIKHFGAMFKKYEGVSPSQYINSLKNN